MSLSGEFCFQIHLKESANIIIYVNENKLNLRFKDKIWADVQTIHGELYSVLCFCYCWVFFFFFFCYIVVVAAV